MTMPELLGETIPIWDAHGTTEEGRFELLDESPEESVESLIVSVHVGLTEAFYTHTIIPTGETIRLQQVHDRVIQLEGTLQEAEGRISSLEEDVEAMKAAQAEEIIVLRSIDREEAKREIGELFETGETLFYSDIATNLRLDLSLVVDLCQELLNEGEIEVHDNAV